jgi:hypothetical protein
MAHFGKQERVPMNEALRTEREAKLEELGEEFDSLARQLVPYRGGVHTKIEGLEGDQSDLDDKIENSDGSVGLTSVWISKVGYESAEKAVKRMQEILDEIHSLAPEKE